MIPLDPQDPPEIGPYRLVARIGAGGMGRVYLARSRAGRPLALKVVRPELSGDKEYRARFRKEIEAARAVASAFTAPVLDADADGERPWLATAYVCGPSLREAVRSHGPMPEAMVRRLGAGMAEALSAIHKAGLVHRDFKPSNVLLAGDGPRVIDFGIARALGGTTLTETDVVVGSAGYMSPEQADGRGIGPASDVFSLGSVLVFAATGRPPFGEGSAHGLLYRVSHSDPDLTGVPASLRGVIAACMNRDPARRPDPAHLARTLSPGLPPPASGWLPERLTDDVARRRASLEKTLAGAPTAGPGRRGLLLAGVAGAAAVAVGGGGAAWLLKDRASARTAAVPRRIWTARLGPLNGHPVPFGGLTLLATSAGVVAVDTKTGAKRWSVADSNVEPWMRGFGDPAPVLHVWGGAVYAPGDTAVLVIDAESGRSRYVDCPRPMNNLWGMTRDGTIISEELASSGPGTTMAFRPSSRSLSWSASLGQLSQVLVPRSGELMYAVDRAGNLIAVEMATGVWRWTHPCDSSAGIYAPVLNGDTVYVSAQSLYAVNAATGARRWRYQSVSPVAVSGGVVYLPDAGHLYALDAATGGRRRDVRGPFEGMGPPPVVAGGMIFFAVKGVPAGRGRDGLYGYDVATGARRWSFPYELSPDAEKDAIWYLSATADHLFATHGPSVFAFRLT